MGTYVIETTMLGKRRIVYRCAECQCELVAEANEAGTGEWCPRCLAFHTVPGTDAAEQMQQAFLRRLRLHPSTKPSATLQEAMERRRLRRAGLVECPACGAAVKGGSVRCPECGHANRSAVRQAVIFGVTLLVTLALAAGLVFYCIDLVRRINGSP